MHDMDSGLLFMDQEKAFDRVSHAYLGKLLVSFGFVGDLVRSQDFHPKWKNAAEVSGAEGLRSMLAGEKLLREALAAMRKLRLKLEAPEDSGAARPSSSFPELRISCTQPPGHCDSRKLLKLADSRDVALKGAPKRVLYACCVKTLHCRDLANLLDTK
ncbi:unnamed protein product [Lampetra fluviatilis]